MNMLKYWLTNPHVIIAKDVLEHIYDFADTVDSSTIMKKLALDVQKAWSLPLLSNKLSTVLLGIVELTLLDCLFLRCGPGPGKNTTKDASITYEAPTAAFWDVIGLTFPIIGLGTGRNFTKEASCCADNSRGRKIPAHTRSWMRGSFLQAGFR
jgi:hypothetical protein